MKLLHILFISAAWWVVVSDKLRGMEKLGFDSAWLYGCSVAVACLGLLFLINRKKSRAVFVLFVLIGAIIPWVASFRCSDKRKISNSFDLSLIRDGGVMYYYVEMRSGSRWLVFRKTDSVTVDSILDSNMK